MKKIFLVLLFVTLGLGILKVSLAQENQNIEQQATNEVNLDQQVSVSDLGIKDPNMLPDSPFYFFKNLGRGIQQLFTFDSTKKAELENKFSNEKLVELKKMVENKVDPEKIKKATENYRKSIEKIKNIADKIKDKAGDNPAVNKFLEKFTNQQVLQEKILQKLETQVPEKVLEKIKEAREQHLEKFQQVMTKLETNQEKIVEKIKNALQNGDVSNPDILEKIKDKMPDDIKQKIEAVRTEIINKVIEKTNQASPSGANCPNVMVADPATFCPNGRIEAERDSNGCITKINCGKSAIEQKCINQKCQANGATCEFDYQCPAMTQENIGCKILWWYDKNNKTCQEKNFCGAYMYFGLQTFETKDECEKSLKEYLNTPTQSQEQINNIINKVGTGEIDVDALLNIINQNQ